MQIDKDRRGNLPHVAARREFLCAGVATGAVLALSSAFPFSAMASSKGTTCNESVREIINIALAAEHLATTFYYMGLTTHSIVSDRRVAGSSANPNAVASDGDRENVAYLQAALDQERQHAELLQRLGATSPYRHFYFPTGTFETLGFTNHQGTYLWVLDHLETAFIGAYLAAMRRFAALGHADFAVLAARIMGVECQHRALYRAISMDDPADNVTLEVGEFSCVSDAAALLAPFFTGKGFPRGAMHAVPLPTSSQTTRVIGSNTSS